jgi:hypothetical protein
LLPNPRHGGAQPLGSQPNGQQAPTAPTAPTNPNPFLRP